VGRVYRADLRGGAGARWWLQRSPQATAVTPHAQVTQVFTAQALGTVRAARGTVIDFNWRDTGSTGQREMGLALRSASGEVPSSFS
jgi:hypothetical protein